MDLATLVRLRTVFLADDSAYESDAERQYRPGDRIDKWREVKDRFEELPAATRRMSRPEYGLSPIVNRMLSEAHTYARRHGWRQADGFRA